MTDLGRGEGRRGWKGEWDKTDEVRVDGALTLYHRLHLSPWMYLSPQIFSVYNVETTQVPNETGKGNYVFRLIS